MRLPSQEAPQSPETTPLDRKPPKDPHIGAGATFYPLSLHAKTAQVGAKTAQESQKSREPLLSAFEGQGASQNPPPPKAKAQAHTSSQVFEWPPKRGCPPSREQARWRPETDHKQSRRTGRCPDRLWLKAYCPHLFRGGRSGIVAPCPHLWSLRHSHSLPVHEGVRLRF